MVNLKIASLNVSNSDFVNEFNPLAFRIYSILDYITKEYKSQNGFDVLCLQEISNSLKYSPIDIIFMIHTCLSKLDPNIMWNFSHKQVNYSSDSFYKVIFWNNCKLGMYDCCMIDLSEFEFNDGQYEFSINMFRLNKDLYPDLYKKKICIANCHVPYIHGNKIDYWKAIAAETETFVKDLDTGDVMIIVGDLNKFSDNLGEYKSIFKSPYVDLIQEQKTFYSFDENLKDDGKHYHDTLDAFIVNEEIAKKASIVVIPKINYINRPSDHFMFIGNVEIE